MNCLPLSMPGEIYLGGRHDFRIIVEDYYQNATVIVGKLFANAPFMLNLSPAQIALGKMTYKKVSASDGRMLKEMSVHAARLPSLKLHKLHWTPLRSNFTKYENSFANAPLENQSQGSNTTRPALEFPNGGKHERADLTIHHKNSKLIRITARDESGAESLPTFVCLDSSVTFKSNFEIKVQKKFLPKYLRFEVATNHLLLEPPKSIFVVNGNTLQPQLIAVEPNRYIGIIPLADIAADSVGMSISARNFAGENSVWYESFSNKPILPGKGGILTANNNGMQVEFMNSSVYWPIYGRVLVDSNRVDDSRVIGPVYNVEPRDAPLSNSATVRIKYPASVELPRQLGVCYKEGKRWRFIDNNLDEKEHTISATVLSMEKFALIRDEEPPPCHHTITQAR